MDLLAYQHVSQTKHSYRYGNLSITLKRKNAKAADDKFVCGFLIKVKYGAYYALLPTKKKKIEKIHNIFELFGRF